MGSVSLYSIHQARERRELETRSFFHLCRPGWPRTQKSPASASQVLELKACATTPRPP
uniref:Uncharacterized protein n=1 Tax=Mus musculus TaxID=10090 RepID=Q6R5E3_MOUSE|nr:unknown [Mus musculus]